MSSMEEVFPRSTDTVAHQGPSDSSSSSTRGDQGLKHSAHVNGSLDALIDLGSRLRKFDEVLDTNQTLDLLISETEASRLLNENTDESKLESLTNSRFPQTSFSKSYNSRRKFHNVDNSQDRPETFHKLTHDHDDNTLSSSHTPRNGNHVDNDLHLWSGAVEDSQVVDHLDPKHNFHHTSADKESQNNDCVNNQSQDIDDVKPTVNFPPTPPNEPSNSEISHDVSNHNSSTEPLKSSSALQDSSLSAELDNRAYDSHLPSHKRGPQISLSKQDCTSNETHSRVPLYVKALSGMDASYLTPLWNTEPDEELLNRLANISPSTSETELVFENNNMDSSPASNSETRTSLTPEDSEVSFVSAYSVIAEDKDSNPVLAGWKLDRRESGHLFWRRDSSTLNGVDPRSRVKFRYDVEVCEYESRSSEAEDLIEEDEEEGTSTLDSDEETHESVSPVVTGAKVVSDEDASFGTIAILFTLGIVGVIVAMLYMWLTISPHGGEKSLKSDL